MSSTVTSQDLSLLFISFLNSEVEKGNINSNSRDFENVINGLESLFNVNSRNSERKSNELLNGESLLSTLNNQNQNQQYNTYERKEEIRGYNPKSGDAYSQSKTTRGISQQQNENDSFDLSALSSAINSFSTSNKAGEGTGSRDLASGDQERGLSFATLLSNPATSSMAQKLLSNPKVLEYVLKNFGAKGLVSLIGGGKQEQSGLGSLVGMLSGGGAKKQESSSSGFGGIISGLTGSSQQTSTTTNSSSGFGGIISGLTGSSQKTSNIKSQDSGIGSIISSFTENSSSSQSHQQQQQQHQSSGGDGLSDLVNNPMVQNLATSFFKGNK